MNHQFNKHEATVILNTRDSHAPSLLVHDGDKESIRSEFNKYIMELSKITMPFKLSMTQCAFLALDRMSFKLIHSS